VCVWCGGMETASDTRRVNFPTHSAELFKSMLKVRPLIEIEPEITCKVSPLLAGSPAISPRTRSCSRWRRQHTASASSRHPSAHRCYRLASFSSAPATLCARLKIELESRETSERSAIEMGKEFSLPLFA
jgi:hypothetical protein